MLSCNVAFWIHACWGTYAIDPVGEERDFTRLPKKEIEEKNRLAQENVGLESDVVFFTIFQ